MNKTLHLILGVLIILGLIDSLFLTYEHYTLTSTGCPVTPTINCLTVTTSEYSVIFGIPLALLGVVYYGFMLYFWYRKEKMFKSFLMFTSIVGVLFSLYLIYIQAFIIGLFCLYCLASASVTFLIFGILMFSFKEERQYLIIDLLGYGYKYVIKNLLFLIDATYVHEGMVDFGKSLTTNKFIRRIFKKFLVADYPSLKTQVLGMKFKSPIGMAAGFDYQAKLFNVTPLIGFGFQTVGTITNIPYEGNPSPQLGRLPKSKSLLVNKGFKNEGAELISSKLKGVKFTSPIGVSLGRSNNADLDTLEKSINDVISAFKIFEKAGIKNSYYELNISCPNIIHGKGDYFYKPNSLDKLLLSIDRLRIRKPIFIKMPIDQSKKTFISLLKVIAKHKISGLIIGNLQTNKNHKSLVKEEVKRFKMGKFSGKPTFEDSNRLIKLTYKKYKDRFVIIGCGGVFNAEDAWVKFENGAALVQLITGMIFEGPQLIAQVNRDLCRMLKEKGFKSISELVGTGV